MCGGVKTPPYNVRETPYQPGNGWQQQTHPVPFLPMGMWHGLYAAPTHRPNPVTTKKRYGKAPGHCGRSTIIFYFFIFNFLRFL